MLAVIRDLFRHQAWADASMVNAIRRHDAAARDPELRKLLHHVLLAHRFWIHLCQGLPFSADAEREVPETLEPIVARYRETQDQEQRWLERLQESDLARMLESPYFADRRVALSDALMQVCLHSQGHRSQSATRLRQLGGEPPTLDYVLWLKDRPEPRWPESSSSIPGA